MYLEVWNTVSSTAVWYLEYVCLDLLPPPERDEIVKGVRIKLQRQEYGSCSKEPIANRRYDVL